MLKGMMGRLAELRRDRREDPMHALGRRAEGPGGSALDPFRGSWGITMVTKRIERFARNIQWFLHDLRFVATGRE